MNEETKDIETCLPENILSEVANVPTDPQFRSLTDEALDPLKQQALQQAGYDGYNEVVMYHQPYTFTSQVKQMKSNLILLLRRLWRFPFGRGTTASSDAGSVSDGSAAGSSAAAPIRSLADMWQHYITRLKGNPEYGIPSRLSQLTDLHDAPALLADRDISSGIRFGENSLPDGMSLAQLFCSTSAASSVTEIVDTNVGWTYNNMFPWSSFPNIKRAVLNCIDHTTGIISAPLEQVELPTLRHSLNGYIIINGALAEEITIPELEDFNGWIDYGYNGKGKVFNCPNLKVLRCPKLHTSAHGTQYAPQSNIVGSCPNLEELYMPSFSYIYNGYIVDNCPKLRKVVFGTLKTDFTNSYGDYKYNFTNGSSTNLIHFEIGAGTAVSLHLDWWLPTNAIDASRTDLIEEGSTAQNNLQQFLSNFKTYIAERITDKGSGLTITLSQEVRNAIHAAEYEYGIENIIITQKGWTISPAPN